MVHGEPPSIESEICLPTRRKLLPCGTPAGKESVIREDRARTGRKNRATEGATDSGREPLDSSGWCAALHRLNLRK